MLAISSPVNSSSATSPRQILHKEEFHVVSKTLRVHPPESRKWVSSRFQNKASDRQKTPTHTNCYCRSTLHATESNDLHVCSADSYRNNHVKQTRGHFIRNTSGTGGSFTFHCLLLCNREEGSKE